MNREEAREYSKLLGRCHRTDFFAVFVGGRKETAGWKL